MVASKRWKMVGGRETSIFMCRTYKIFYSLNTCMCNFDKGRDQFQIINVVSVTNKKNVHTVSSNKGFISLVDIKAMIKINYHSNP